LSKTGGVDDMNTNINKELLCKLLDDGESYRGISKILNIHHNTVYYYVHKFGLESHTRKHLQDKHNASNYFEVIDTKEKAYMLGFILGDGCIKDDYLDIAVAKDDRAIVDYIANTLGSKICESNKLDKKKRIFPHVRTCLRVPHLNKHVGGNKKEDRHYPRVRKDLEQYLLRGFFDADGCISWGYRKDRGKEYKRMWHFIDFANHLKCLSGVQKMLINTLEIPTIVRPRSDGAMYNLRFDGRENVLKFLRYIYKDETFMILDRKYNKYKAMCLELGEFGEN
jgi:hypothetical protein